jgi:hypothetical protein
MHTILVFFREIISVEVLSHMTFHFQCPNVQFTDVPLTVTSIFFVPSRVRETVNKSTVNSVILLKLLYGKMI